MISTAAIHRIVRCRRILRQHTKGCVKRLESLSIADTLSTIMSYESYPQPYEGYPPKSTSHLHPHKSSGQNEAIFNNPNRPPLRETYQSKEEAANGMFNILKASEVIEKGLQEVNQHRPPEASLAYIETAPGEAADTRQYYVRPRHGFSKMQYRNGGSAQVRVQQRGVSIYTPNDLQHPLYDVVVQQEGEDTILFQIDDHFKYGEPDRPDIRFIRPPSEGIWFTPDTALNEVPELRHIEQIAMAAATHIMTDEEPTASGR